MSNKLRPPQPIVAFIEATNGYNAGEFFATLTDSAVITDEGHEYRGISTALHKYSEVTA